MISACWTLRARPELEHLSLRPWAHMLGFRGHYSTRSRLLLHHPDCPAPRSELERHLGVERPKPSHEALVDAFARLVGLAEAS